MNEKSKADAKKKKVYMKKTEKSQAKKLPEPKRTYTLQELLKKANKNKAAVTIFPNDLERAPRNRMVINEGMIDIAYDLAEQGLTDSDIMSILGMSSSAFSYNYKQGYIVKKYIEESGISLKDLPNTLNVYCEELGEMGNLYYPELRCRFYMAIEQGRAEGNKKDLTTIREAGKKDWKASAYVLERRSPEYKKDYEKKETGTTNIVNNFGDNIIDKISKITKEVKKERLENKAGDEIIDAEYEEE